MDPVDWQTGKTHLECTKYILEHQLNCDVNFKVGENNETIKAHKLILSMRSAVFDRMFNGGFQESEKKPVIPDVTVGAFKTLLRYCYYECLDIEDDVALSVLYASTKYMLPLLEKAARKKLIQILNGSNIWDVYKYAISVGDKELYKVSKKYFLGSVIGVREALHTDEFLNIPHEVLLEFLQINDNDKTMHLNEKLKDGEKPDTNNSDNQKEKEVGEETEEEEEEASFKEAESCENNVDCRGISISEIELFKACNVWAEAECLRQEINPTGANKRTMLGECLFLIRFPTIQLKYLVTIVYPTGILTQAEIANLGQYIHKDPGSQCQVDFPSKGRDFIVTSPASNGYSDKRVVLIETTERVLLSRIWTEYPANYKVTLRDEGFKKSWFTKETQHENHWTKSGKLQLYFIDMEPQVLEAGGKYTLTVEETEEYEHRDDDQDMEKVMIEQRAPFKEVKLSNTSGADNIYGLTLCLV